MSPARDAIDIRILRLSETDPSDWAEPLGPGEHLHAERFRNQDDRDRFRIGRGLLRTLLGDALGIAPAALELKTDANGKPTLATPCDLAFNVSHSGDLVCVALGKAAAIGVDVERQRRDFDPLALGAHVLTPREMAALATADDPFAAFFEAWVQKEALLKGIGTGLLRDPRDIEITPSPDGPRIAFAAEAGLEGAEHWQVGPLAVPAGYHGALAVLPSTMRVRSASSPTA